MKNLILDDVSSLTILVTLVVILLVIVIKNFRFDTLWRNCPGPWGIPILGFYPFLRKDYHVQLTEMSEVYGDPYLLSVGGKLYLHLSSHKTLREAHLTNSDCFPGRCPEFSALQHLLEDGVLYLNDEAWRSWRKFMGQSMRELGLTPRENVTESGLSDSVQATLNSLAESKGQPIEISGLLITQCTEMVRRLTLGNKVSLEKGMKFNEIYHKGNLILGTVGILFSGTIARYLILPRIKTFKELLNARKELDVMLYDILDDHKRNFNFENPKDFIDLYLREKKIREEKSDPQVKHFTDKILVGTLKQVYGDTGFSIGTIVAFYLMVLASKADVQNKIYEEILQEIGTERLPNYGDRNKLPFMCSVMKEIERTTDSLPVFPGLECSRDTTVSGVFVPKGTITLVNTYAIHKNPAVYKDPDLFDPERFMPDKETERSKEEPPVSFGIGKRACAGEQLVKSELFVFLTAIMQHFVLRPEETDLSKQNESGSNFDEINKMRIVAIPRSDSPAL